MNLKTEIWRLASRFIPATKFDAQKLQNKVMTLTDAITALTTATTANTAATAAAITALGNGVVTPAQVSSIITATDAITAATASLVAATPVTPTP